MAEKSIVKYVTRAVVKPSGSLTAIDSKHRRQRQRVYLSKFHRRTVPAKSLLFKRKYNNRARGNDWILHRILSNSFVDTKKTIRRFEGTIELVYVKGSNRNSVIQGDGRNTSGKVRRGFSLDLITFINTSQYWVRARAPRPLALTHFHGRRYYRSRASNARRRPTYGDFPLSQSLKRLSTFTRSTLAIAISYMTPIPKQIRSNVRD